tara:strand:- start:1664 stop:1924 length:261 start_codon:yes stop_codon:yes gene_type:complete
MIYAFAAMNAVSLLALAYSLKLASAERRILFAASLQSKGDTDAARRAAGPTHSEAKAAVDQQLKIQKEIKENGGAFIPPGAKPVGV